jgi:hypothetical protein
MNPLIPTNAIQIRYISPLYEPIYDEEDNAVDEECVRHGTDVLNECILTVSKDKLPRYYRLRYRENAKDHKRRWEDWLEENLINGRTPYFIKVKKIGRRVLFEYDPTLIEKREKKQRAIQHKKEMRARKDDEDDSLTTEQQRALDNLPNGDRLVGETEQGELIYEDRESGDRYEER